MSDSIEKRHENLQWQLLGGFVLGTVGAILREVLKLDSNLASWGTPVSLLALCGWFWCVVVFLRMRKLGTLDHTGQYLSGSRDDERTQQLRLRSVYFAFVVVLILQLILEISGSLLARQSGIVLSAALGANLTFATAIITSLGRYLYLDRHE